MRFLLNRCDNVAMHNSIYRLEWAVDLTRYRSNAIGKQIAAITMIIKPYSVCRRSQRSLPFKPLEKKEGRNFIADKQTKVVELVTFDSRLQMLYGLIIILISPYLFPLSIWIQITIHPLSTDGAIVIY